MKSKGLGLKIVVGLMLLFLVLFISSSLLARESSYSNEIIINKPINEVFEKLSDSNFLPKWNPLAENVTAEKATANKVGSIYLIKAKQQNKAFQVKQTITKYNKNNAFGDILDVENMISVNDYILSDENGKTKLIKHTTIKGKGHFIRWVTKIYKGNFKAAEQKSLTLFKQALEQ